MNRVKVMSVALGVLMASCSVLAKESVIVMTPVFEPGLEQENQNIDPKVIVEKLQHSLQQSLVMSGDYDVQSLENKGDEKKHREAQENSHLMDNEDALLVNEQPLNNNVDWSINVVVTSAIAERVIKKMSPTVSHYRDTGSLSVTFQLIDRKEQLEKKDTRIQPINDHLAYSNNVTVSDVTPFKTLASPSHHYVDAQFWNTLSERTSTEIVADLIENAN